MHHLSLEARKVNNKQAHTTLPSMAAREGSVCTMHTPPVACIDTCCYSGTPTLETYYSNFIAKQL